MDYFAYPATLARNMFQLAENKTRFTLHYDKSKMDWKLHLH